MNYPYELEKLATSAEARAYSLTRDRVEALDYDLTEHAENLQKSIDYYTQYARELRTEAAEAEQNR